ncbi:TPA: chromosome partitioning protein MukE, partial [Pasteurella multocida]|nr:chromosome partitioning protein MukE [Pasteurella multocida]
ALEKQADLNEVDDNDELEDELDDEEHA